MRFYATGTVVTLAMLLGGSVARAGDGQDYWVGGQGPQGSCAAGEGCDNCLDSGSCRRPCWGFVAGVEATYLKPNIRSESTLFADSFETIDSGRLATFTDMVGSPRIWLGVETDRGWGFRGRYWEYNARKSKDDLTFWELPDILKTVSANSRLHTYAVDAELTRRIDRCDWCALASFGLRNTGLKVNHGFDLFKAELFEEYQLILLGTATTTSMRQLDATGLTGSLEVRRPFGDCGLVFACNLRGSVLWGKDKVLGTSRLFVGDVIPVMLVQPAEASDNTTQYIVESQIGLEWSRRIECLRGCAFAHVMFEYQRWTANESAANFDLSQSFNDISVSMKSIEPNIDFAGVAVAIGFTR
jgi:hypothetical protein